MCHNPGNVGAGPTGRARRRSWTAGLLAGLVLACAPPLELADWTMPVAESTIVIEHAGLPPEGRSERIELALDLVLGADADDPDSLFYDLRTVDVDADGNIYALDAGARHVKVFGPDGRLRRTLGGEGQGPGELTRPYGMAIVGGRLVVNDAGNARLSQWALDGTHVADPGFPVPVYGSIAPSKNGHVLGLRSERSGDFIWPKTAVLVSMQGEVVREYARAPLTELEAVSRRDEGFIGWAAVPSAAADEAGNVYFADGEEYQVHKLDFDGEPLWSMRVAWRRRPTPAEDIELRLQSQLERFPDETRNDYYWPELLPAIAGIAVDDRGHLWVFPHVHVGPEDDPPTERPVDVYDGDGRPLFRGVYGHGTPWHRVRGDRVYTIETGADGEDIIKRYRSTGGIAGGTEESP